MKLIAILVLVAVAGLALSVPVSSGEDEERIRVIPKQGGWELEELLRTISEYTGESIVYDPASPQVSGRKIEFVGVQEVPRENLFEWFQSLLSFQRMLLVPVGLKQNLWMLVDLNSPLVTSRPIFVNEEDVPAWEDRAGVYIVTSIKLPKGRETVRLRSALASLSTRGIGQVHDVPDQSTIVICDLAPKVAAMCRIVAEVMNSAGRTELTGSALARYEEMLMNSRTEVAARYFLAKIEGE